MINILLINQHSYCFLSMSLLDGAHEYFEYNNDQDDNFIMMMMILAMIMIFKCLLSAIDFATRYSTRYSDFLSQPYSNPTRSQKTLLAGACPPLNTDSKEASYMLNYITHHLITLHIITLHYLSSHCQLHYTIHIHNHHIAYHRINITYAIMKISLFWFNPCCFT